MFLKDKPSVLEEGPIYEPNVVKPLKPTEGQYAGRFHVGEGTN